mgnify:CR=1 FL=1|jgi:hypothetical protein
MKPAKIVMNIVIIGLLLVILRQVLGRGISGFGADLTTTPGAGMSAGPSSIFGLKHDISCTASGFNPQSAYYSKSLTPGGWCKDMDFVRNQERDYTIDGGIGGSLLSK